MSCNLVQIFDLFDVNRDGVIEFGEFVQSLSVFHPDTPEAEKISCKKLLFITYITCLESI